MSFILGLLQKAATFVGGTVYDVYVYAAIFFFALVFVVLGTKKSYGAFYWLLLGVILFIVIRSLLQGSYQVEAVAKVFSKTFTIFLVNSFAYLIFMLFFLLPINADAPVNEAQSKLGKLVERFFVAGLAISLLLSCIVLMTEQKYIFKDIASAFSLLKKYPAFVDHFVTGKAYVFFMNSGPIIIVMSVFFGVYKLLLADMLKAVVATILASMLKGKKKAAGGGGGDAHGGGHDDAHGGHDDGHGGWHDDHGGGGHDDAHADAGHDDHWHGGGHH